MISICYVDPLLNVKARHVQSSLNNTANIKSYKTYCNPSYIIFSPLNLF